MNPITDSRRTILLIELHRAIEDAATKTARALANGTAGDGLAYPPNERLSREEAASLKQLSVDAVTERALAKAIADSTASAVFTLFLLMDAVADPEAPFDGDVWLGAQLAEPDEDDHPMMHDAFFDTYRDYRGAS